MIRISTDVMSNKYGTSFPSLMKLLMISCNEADEGNVAMSEEDECNREGVSTDIATLTPAIDDDEDGAGVSSLRVVGASFVSLIAGAVVSFDIATGINSISSNTELLGILQYRNKDELSSMDFLNFKPNGKASDADGLYDGRKRPIAAIVVDRTVSLGDIRNIFLVFLYEI